MLIFAATATPIVNEKTKGSVTLLGNAATAGLAIMIVIFATGHISGAHVNPAITIAFASLRHFPWVQVRLKTQSDRNNSSYVGKVFAAFLKHGEVCPLSLFLCS